MLACGIAGAEIPDAEFLDESWRFAARIYGGLSASGNNICNENEK
jgi:hypothetical protein